MQKRIPSFCYVWIETTILLWKILIFATYKRFGTLEGRNLKLPNNVIKKGLFNNYFMLKLPLFNPPNPHHHASSQIIARPTFCYVTPDIDTLLYHFFFFFFLKLKINLKIRTLPWHIQQFFEATKPNCQL